ncbi:helix-turn-helix transcriptional regulator [Roseivivax sp. GX 12232]|uniref:helix-turn-helix domain-containing protein n=1 Tax=Roseivivax sp. GX 12232 TaxID=2900547 RepID=UPI001E50380A|nr:helix-turn-helix transcriptional regulator [Roseivivax sp. GX 12232]MCE0506404.1 helix-turn-helix transcriptional regulator [Roseivivax sp. GX 12232]
MTNSPTARLIAEAVDASGKTQREIAEEVGFPRQNVISMLRSGEMRLPVDRAPALARVLGIDEKLLISTAMTEYMPETWNALTGAGSAFPEIQINVKGPAPVMERFKAICAAERRTYAGMLERLMSGYDPELDKLLDEI